MRYRRDWTWLHKAAANGLLDQIPPELLTQENLLVAEGKNGWTPFHLAARTGCLDKLPAAMVTLQNLLSRDHVGRTPMHEVIGGKIEQVPRAFLTEKVLRTADNNGFSLFHEAAITRHLHHLPAETVRIETMMLATRIGITAGSYICFVEMARRYVADGIVPSPGLLDYARYEADDDESAAEFVAIANLLVRADAKRRTGS